MAADSKDAKVVSCLKISRTAGIVMDHAPCNETEKPNGPRAAAARGPFALATPYAGPHPVTGKS